MRRQRLGDFAAQSEKGILDYVCDPLLERPGNWRLSGRRVQDQDDNNGSERVPVFVSNCFCWTSPARRSIG
jgi:hypothetical protein